jgi:hypothetical protein
MSTQMLARLTNNSQAGWIERWPVSAAPKRRLRLLQTGPDVLIEDAVPTRKAKAHTYEGEIDSL